MRQNVVTPLLGAFLLLSVGWAPAAQQPTPKYLKTLINDTGRSRSDAFDRKTDANLASTIARVRRAFERGDAHLIEECLEPNSRIRVSLTTRGDETGYFRPSQVMFMFEDLFDERRTRTFVFEPVELDSNDDTSSHVHAQWSYTIGDDEVSEHLRFKLLRRKDDWYISEILTVPR